MCFLSTQTLIPLWLVISDFDYCSGCYEAHWQEHNGGEHRFVLCQYPIPSIVIKRTAAPLKMLTGDANPWKIEDRPVPDAATPQHDEGEVDAIVTEGMSRTSSWTDWYVPTELR